MSKEEGFLGGGLAGAGTGAMIGSVVPGLGTAIGAGVGFAVGGLIGLMGSSSAEKAEEEEARRRNIAQANAVMREFGIMQQKQNQIMAGAQQRSNKNSSKSGKPQNNSGDIATQTLSESGFIGQNMVNSGGSTPSASGTF